VTHSLLEVSQPCSRHSLSGTEPKYDSDASLQSLSAEMLVGHEIRLMISDLISTYHVQREVFT
jgi:hypothetical protein